MVKWLIYKWIVLLVSVHMESWIAGRFLDIVKLIVFSSTLKQTNNLKFIHLHVTIDEEQRLFEHVK